MASRLGLNSQEPAESGAASCALSNARVVKSVDTRDLSNLSLRGETPEVKPVKVGESPGCSGIRANAEPSPASIVGKV